MAPPRSPSATRSPRMPDGSVPRHSSSKISTTPCCSQWREFGSTTRRIPGPTCSPALSRSPELIASAAGMALSSTPLASVTTARWPGSARPSTAFPSSTPRPGSRSAPTTRAGLEMGVPARRHRSAGAVGAQSGASGGPIAPAIGARSWTTATFDGRADPARRSAARHGLAVETALQRRRPVPGRRASASTTRAGNTTGTSVLVWDRAIGTDRPVQRLRSRMSRPSLNADGSVVYVGELQDSNRHRLRGRLWQTVGIGRRGHELVGAQPRRLPARGRRRPGHRPAGPGDADRGASNVRPRRRGLRAARSPTTARAWPPGSADRTVNVWDVATGRRSIEHLRGHSSPVRRRLTSVPDDDTLYTTERHARGSPGTSAGDRRVRRATPRSKTAQRSRLNLPVHAPDGGTPSCT